MKSNAVLGRRPFLTCVATAVAIASSGGARSDQTVSESGTPCSPSEEATVTPDGRFPATVDRIVDGEHVVLLVETHGEVIAQYDVARTTLPTIREGDRVLVTVSDTALTAVYTGTGTRRGIDRVRPTAAAW